MAKARKQKTSPANGYFGSLEQAVLRIVRQRRIVSVGDVHKHLNKSRTIAYTTVMTIMTRLANKGVVVRRKNGRRFIYELPAEHRRDVGVRLRQFFDGLLVGLRSPAIRHFVESVSAVDDQMLAELEKEVQLAKLRRRRKSDG